MRLLAAVLVTLAVLSAPPVAGEEPPKAPVAPPAPPVPAPPVPAPPVPAPPVPAAPARPEVPVRYLGAAQVSERLVKIAAAGPAPASVRVYGRSAGGRPLEAILVGRADLPVVLVHGGVGARDVAGTAAALDLAARLVEGPAPGEADPLARVAFLIVPAPNPDALDAFLRGLPWGRGGPDVDRDKDGSAGEDGPDDLDGDGEIVQMRRRIPDGAWVVDDAPPKDGKAMGDPRLLREAGVDARRAVSYGPPTDEGKDDDQDGEVNEDPPGTDLTRNFMGVWEEMGAWPGDGPYPGSAPEVRALMEMSYETPNLLAWYGFSSEGPRLERASERGKDADADDALYGLLAPRWKARAGGVEVRKASERPGAAENPGSDLDWAARHLGVVALRIPVWRIAKEEKNGRDRADPDELDWLLWNDRVLHGRGFVPWHEVPHPQWERVEVGGWKRFTRHEPPADLLPAAVRAVSLVPTVHAEFAPRLDLLVEVRRADAEVTRVAVRVEDVGGGPTETRRAEAARRAMPVRLALEPAPGAVVVAGPRLADLGTLQAGGISSEVVWLVRRAGAGPLGRVTARHRVAGTVSREVATP